MNLALFDFDGTITSRETFPDFIRAAVPPRRLTAGRVVLAPLVAGYRLGLVGGSPVRAAVVGFGFRGVREDAVREAGAAFAARVLPTVLRPGAMARIDWQRARGDRVVVVSGGLDLYLAPWCERHGLELICSSLEARDGALTGRFHGAQCVGPEKPRRVRERCVVEGFPVVHAYGDTREDFDLLAIAHRRVYRGAELA
jgi:HAD superfamily hydrolase (TIGR01490 family)